MYLPQEDLARFGVTEALLTPTASNIRIPASGFTTKEAYSSSGSPHHSTPNV